MDSRTLRTSSEIFNKDKHWMNNFTSNSVDIFDQKNKRIERPTMNGHYIPESDGIAHSLRNGLRNIYVHGPEYRYFHSANDPISYPYQYQQTVSPPSNEPVVSRVPGYERQKSVELRKNHSPFSNDSENLDYLNIGPVVDSEREEPVQGLLKIADTTSPKPSTTVSFNSQAAIFQKKLTDLKTNLEEVLSLLSGLMQVVDDKALADYEEKMKKIAHLFH